MPVLLRRLLLAAPLLALVAAAPRRVPFGPPPPPTPFDLCDAAIGAAAAKAMPDMLLPAIARVESGRYDPVAGRVRPWPWTINVEGVGSYFATKEEAIAAVEALQARGIRSIDTGCMQVNLYFHPTAFADLHAAFDPAANAGYAARFLTALHAQTRDWNLATAMYHSQTQERGEDYQRRVFGRVMTPMGPAGPLKTGAMFAAVPLPNAIYGAMPPATLLFGAFAPAQTAFRQTAFSTPMPSLAKAQGGPALRR